MEYGFERPVALWGGVLYEADVGQRREPVKTMHTFGGGLDLEARGFPQGKRPLHRLLTLDLSDENLALPATQHRLLPFCYGFAYSGCRLTYKVLDDATLEIETFDPKAPTVDWPHADYPKQFESRPMTWRRVRSMSNEEAQGLTWQGLDVDIDSQLIVVVPPSKDYGVSLWGDIGDAEQVQVVFSFDPVSAIVRATNQCS